MASLLLVRVSVSGATPTQPLLPPQPPTQASRTPRMLSRARKKDPLGLVSGGLASLLDTHLLGGRGNGFIIMLIIINY